MKEKLNEGDKKTKNHFPKQNVIKMGQSNLCQSLAYNFSMKNQNLNP